MIQTISTKRSDGGTVKVWNPIKYRMEQTFRVCEEETPSIHQSYNDSDEDRYPGDFTHALAVFDHNQNKVLASGYGNGNITFCNLENYNPFRTLNAPRDRINALEVVKGKGKVVR